MFNYVSFKAKTVKDNDYISENRDASTFFMAQR